MTNSTEQVHYLK